LHPSEIKYSIIAILLDLIA